ncbi:helix-turn-helix transcriptional regulator [Zophobihabitans entericus]|uniref:Helix-turn-helix transcriptional regulator n=1 Tax=Zophobihabitans entericus TaxID=1635327 RepID=A0A6G9I9B4_9GAMM|nr:helix-turn-helix transcriptional regulator [Zophobihabitans entericus]QIQ20815.1 helix-turn-helix transcriptional regulator [Zophobihabitans entericus]
MAQWQDKSVASEFAHVLPDGCQDLIVCVKPGERPEWFISDLSDSAYIVKSESGQWFMGARLHPGALISSEALLKTMESKSSFDHQDMLENISYFVTYNQNVTEALTSLSQKSSLKQIVTHLGVSERTLQRLMMKYTKRSPQYWQALARIRQSARLVVNSDMTLIDIASESGFSDQAHFNREFKRWFSTSPGQFRQHTILNQFINDSGYN